MIYLNLQYCFDATLLYPNKPLPNLCLNRYAEIVNVRLGDGSMRKG